MKSRKNAVRIHRADKDDCQAWCGVHLPRNTSYKPELVTCPSCRAVQKVSLAVVGER